MAQLSIFEKQRHFSDKDFTCSVGKYNTIYMTFRHDSWKRFTSSDKIAVYLENDLLIFSDPEDNAKLPQFTLKKTHGDPETTEHTRYLQISGKAWPGFLEAALNMAGSFNFDEAPKIKTVSDEDIEKLKELLANAGPTKLEVVQETVPKGFIEVYGAAAGERVLIKASSIKEVCEVVPGSRITPTFLRPEEAKAKTVIFGDRTGCFLDIYEDVIVKIRNALEV